MRGVWLIIMVLVAMPAAVAQGDLLSPEERAWVDAHGPIRYAPDPGYPPFEQVLPDGSVEGINVDLLNRISRNLDIEFETVVYANWTAVLEAMEAGEVDLLGSLARTAERDVYMDFYGPYMELGEVFYVRADSPFTSNEEMAGKRVAVIQDYAAATWLGENRPDIQLVPVPDMRAGLEAVTTGSVDAFFENVPVTGYVIRREGFTNIRILDEPLYYSPANWGVPEGNEILLSIMAKGMGSIPQGEQAAVFEYWSGYDLGVRRDLDTRPAWLAPVLWGFAAVALLAGLWIVALRRTVHRRTEELRNLNEELEDRVAERTAELQKANKALDAFASSVTHDLQKPLSAMKMHAKVASLQMDKGVQPDFASLEMQIKRMEAFIESMLQFSRVSQPEHRRDTRLAPIVEELGALLATGEGQPRRLDVIGDPVAHADPELLRTVLLNLLGNAWKFTDAIQDPAITVGADDRGFYVKDNGVGFEAEALGQRIFEPFVRADSAAGVPGRGIGLATVSRIVQVHGGQVWAESEPGKGATFRWTMPSDPP